MPSPTFRRLVSLGSKVASMSATVLPASKSSIKSSKLRPFTKAVGKNPGGISGTIAALMSLRTMGS